MQCVTWMLCGCYTSITQVLHKCYTRVSQTNTVGDMNPITGHVMCLGPNQLRAWNKPTQCAGWVCLFIDSAMSNLTVSAVGIELPILSKESGSANHFTNQAPLIVNCIPYKCLNGKVLYKFF